MFPHIQSGFFLVSLSLIMFLLETFSAPVGLITSPQLHTTPNHCSYLPATTHPYQTLPKTKHPCPQLPRIYQNLNTR